MIEIERLFASLDSKISDVMECLNATAKGIALVTDADRHLLGTITDGDIRRGMLAGIDLDAPASALLRQRAQSSRPTPLAMPAGTRASELLRLMLENSLMHIPLMDVDQRVVDLALLSELTRERDETVNAVVMAGGLGKRLRPLTDHLPKPMLPVGGRPLLERILEQLVKAGIRRVSVTTHYKEQIIADYFRDGRDFGVELSYLHENEPLGTAGSVGTLEPQDGPTLVMNGDILTTVDFRAMMAFHREHDAAMTVGVRRYEFSVPYGVLETDGVNVTAIREKPVIRQFINAGIYLLSPAAQRRVPNKQYCDMPVVIAGLLADHQVVVSFPIHEYWIDIGQTDDYEKAVTDMANHAVK